jgi:hypothetical protein
MSARTAIHISDWIDRRTGHVTHVTDLVDAHTGKVIAKKAQHPPPIGEIQRGLWEAHYRNPAELCEISLEPTDAPEYAVSSLSNAALVHCYDGKALRNLLNKHGARKDPVTGMAIGGDYRVCKAYSGELKLREPYFPSDDEAAIAHDAEAIANRLVAENAYVRSVVLSAPDSLQRGHDECTLFAVPTRYGAELDSSVQRLAVDVVQHLVRVCGPGSSADFVEPDRLRVYMSSSHLTRIWRLRMRVYNGVHWLELMFVRERTEK